MTQLEMSPAKPVGARCYQHSFVWKCSSSKWRRALTVSANAALEGCHPRCESIAR